MKTLILISVLVLSIILIGVTAISHFQKIPEKKTETVQPVSQKIIQDSIPKVITEKKTVTVENKKVEVKQPTKELRDPNSKDIANVYWHGKYPLYSFISDKEIKPIYGNTYEVWYATNEDPTPKKIKIEKGNSLTAYKFISYDECATWCNQKKKPTGSYTSSQSNNYSSQQSIPSQSNSVAGFYSSSMNNNWIRLNSNATGKLYINDDILSFGSITFNWTLSGGKINIQFYDEVGQAASYWFYYSENRIEVPSISNNMIFIKTN